MGIKYTLKKYVALRVFVESIIMMLSWCYVLYCEDFQAVFVYFALIYYSFYFTYGSMKTVWGLVMISFTLTYFLSLSSLSSYNSPRLFPHKLLPNDKSKPLELVYPNVDNFWFGIPQSMSLYWWFNGIKNCPETGATPTVGNCTVPVDQMDYFGFYWTAVD